MTKPPPVRTRTRSSPDKLPSLLLLLMQNSEFTLTPPSRRGTRSSPLGAGLWVASSWLGVPAVQVACDSRGGIAADGSEQLDSFLHSGLSFLFGRGADTAVPDPSPFSCTLAPGVLLLPAGRSCVCGPAPLGLLEPA